LEKNHEKFTLEYW